MQDEVHLIDIMRSANFLPGDLADASEQYDFEGTPRRRTGNETEPLQRNTRRYSLNAIKRKEPKEVVFDPFCNFISRLLQLFQALKQVFYISLGKCQTYLIVTYQISVTNIQALPSF